MDELGLRDRVEQHRAEIRHLHPHRLRVERYRFYRELADAAYQRATDPPPPRAIDDESYDERTRARLISIDMTTRVNAILSAEREGFFHSTAMIDAYFSCLEHRLVLLRAFMGRPFAQGEVLALLGMKWAAKLKLVLPAPLSPAAAQVVARMRRIKERIRNPFAHGGVENDQGSLFFRLPGIGSIPGTSPGLATACASRCFPLMQTITPKAARQPRYLVALRCHRALQIRDLAQKPDNQRPKLRVR